MKKSKNKKRVLVAMSGGIDSSLAALILKKGGFDVVGATMKIWPKDKCLEYDGDKSCCSISLMEDAKQIAYKIGIPHYTFDMHEVFKKEVIDYFGNEYDKGRTPNPCIVCNQKIKFGYLLSKAKGLGCDYIATGHYADIGYSNLKKRYYLKEGSDKAKDQSYFLAFISQDVLSHVIFPLARMTKAKARSLAKRHGLRVHDKKSSQEICFVNGHYSDYIQKNRGQELMEGNIINDRGEVLGRHKGIHLYTLGQRKGLGIAYKEPLYVVGIDKKSNTITVCTKEEISKKIFTVKDLEWGLIDNMDRPVEAMCKIRYTHKKAKAVIDRVKRSRYRVTFNERQIIPTPGQAAVFYRGDKILVAGWIDSVLE